MKQYETLMPDCTNLGCTHCYHDVDYDKNIIKMTCTNCKKEKTTDLGIVPTEVLKDLLLEFEKTLKENLN